MKARLREKRKSADRVVHELKRRGRLRLPSKSELRVVEASARSSRAVVTKIFFVKTHATGSSTLSNIFHRFCNAHNVQCYIPPQALSASHTVNGLELTKYIKTEAAKHVHIWPNHVFLEPNLVNLWMPDAVKMSIFREPLSRLVSSYSHPGRTDLLESVLNNLTHNKDVTGGGDPCGPQGIRMSEHVRPHDFPVLDFVVLTEKFDLALVMLRRRLGWKTKDIVYLSIKDSEVGADDGFHYARQQLEAYLRKSPDDMTPAGRNLMKECVWGDESEVYSLAVNRFNKQWAVLSTMEQLSIIDEVEFFARVLNDLQRCCNKHHSDSLCLSLGMDMWPWVQKERLSLFFVENSVCQAAIAEYDDFASAA